MKNHMLLVSAGILLAALPAWANPTPTFHTRESQGHVDGLVWKLSAVQLRDGVALEARQRVNAALIHLTDHILRERLAALEQGARSDALQCLEVQPFVHFLSSELLSVEILTTTYELELPLVKSFKTLAANFDLSTGAPLPPRALFAEGADVMRQVAARVVEALRREESYRRALDSGAMRSPTAADLERILVEPDGLTFVWDRYALGTSEAMATPKAKLRWELLRGLLNEEGPLQRLIPTPTPPVVDGALGTAAPNAAPDAKAVASYLRALGELAHDAAAGLGAEERRVLGREMSRWASSTDSVPALIASFEELELASLVVATREGLRLVRARFPGVDTDALAAEEATALADNLMLALETTESGRVMGIRRMHLPNGNSELLTHGTTVAVVRRADGGSPFHQVRRPGTPLGWIHREHVLIETPLTLEGKVHHQPAVRSLRFGSPTGPRIVAEAGPGQPDTTLARLANLSRSGQSPRLRLRALRRELGVDPPWLVVLDFQLDVQRSLPGESDERGITDRLSGRRDR